MPHKYTRTPLAERFWQKVAISGPDDCWIWQAAKFPNGYGHIVMDDGRHSGAHRAAYLLTYGEASIPDNLLILHSCPLGDRPDCVNPRHLRPGTHADNNADMMSRGRHRTLSGDESPSHLHPERLPRGEQSPKAVLTEETARLIRREYATEQVSTPMLAARLNVSIQTVHDVLSGRTWKYLPLLPGEASALLRRTGDTHLQSSLTSGQKGEIVRLYQGGNTTQVDLAKVYGVNRAVIGRVLRAAGIEIGRGVRPTNAQRAMFKHVV